MELLDKNGKLVSIGDVVNVPPPTQEDQWQNEFTGTVECIKDDYIIVVDGDGDNWCVEVERLEVEE